MLKKYYLVVLALALSFSACMNELSEIDMEAPAVPRGVASTTGDEMVTISWYPNHEGDFDIYHVYRSAQENTGYYFIGATDQPFFVDRDVVNGETYFYAVAALDYSGNESELSYDLVHDTPRPEGYGVRIYNFRQFPDIAGYDFSDFAVLHYRAGSTDIYFEYHPDADGFFINAFSDDTDIQDYGYTESMDEISYAPEQGWSDLGYVEAIVGHTYIVWTHDNHFAKIRITQLNQDLVEFDWAYQTDPGNHELKVSQRDHLP
ncbi:MAG: hypothetical protein H6695_21065 [Deferribacteres bacterium]|nr:hypothetical protein [candidate division KSB1 bacterium]MCB9512679.1 hypothetical protein [Deferribacteres bacterium]